MTKHDYGPLQIYQVIWRSGHVETVQAHQVLWPRPNLFSDELPTDPRVLIHGMFDDHWRLVLAADAADILSIRLMTHAEVEERS